MATYGRHVGCFAMLVKKTPAPPATPSTRSPPRIQSDLLPLARPLSWYALHSRHVSPARAVPRPWPTRTESKEGDENHDCHPPLAVFLVFVLVVFLVVFLMVAILARALG